MKLISVVPSRLLSSPITRASPCPLTAIPNPYHSSKLSIFSFGGDLVSKLRISGIRNGFLHFPTHDLMRPCLHPNPFFPCSHSSKTIFLSKATLATGAMDIIPPWLLRKVSLWIMSFFTFNAPLVIPLSIKYVYPFCLINKQMNNKKHIFNEHFFGNILMLLSLELFFYKAPPRFILCDSTALVHFLVHAPWLSPFHCIKNALLHPLTQMTSIWVIILHDLSCWRFTCSWSFGFAFHDISLSLSWFISALVAHLLVPWLVSVSRPFPPISLSSFTTWFTFGGGSCSYQCFTSKCIPWALVPYLQLFSE